MAGSRGWRPCCRAPRRDASGSGMPCARRSCAALRLELTGDEDAVVARCQLGVVDVVDQPIDVGAEGVEGKEPGDIEHHEARALGDAVPTSELRLAVLRVAEAAVGKHSGHDLHEERDAEALVTTEPLELRDRSGVRVGRGIAVLVVRPTLGDGRVATLARQQDLVSRRGGGRDVVDDVRVRAPRAPHTRTGWWRRAGWSRRTVARSSLRSEMPSPSTRRPTRASCSTPGHAEMGELPDRHRRHAVLRALVRWRGRCRRRHRPDRTRARRRAARWSRRRRASSPVLPVGDGRCGRG